MAKINIKSFLSLNNLRNYYKWNIKTQLILGGAVFLLVLIAGTFFILINEYKSLNKFIEKEAQLKSQFVEKNKQAVNLDLYKLQLVEITQASDELLKQLPNKSEVEKLLVDINQSGVGRGLRFDLFKPGKEKIGEYYAELPIAIKVTGNYNSIGHFASDVSQLSRVVILKDITLSTDTANEDNLVMVATAQTFRYLDQDEINKQKEERKAKNIKTTKKTPAKRPVNNKGDK